MGRKVSGADGRERVFLSAEWRDLVMLNYEVEPRLLRDYVPRGTELDSFGGKTYISLVGFRFLRTKLFGWLPLPFHANFDEVNLRFYVRRREDDEERPGVVFIREIAPKRAVAIVARLAYGENYVRYPMRHRVISNGAGISAEYEWRLPSHWARLHAEAAGDPVLPADGSIEQFVSEHYWGYSVLPGSPFRRPGSPSMQRDGGTVEYHVTHAQWRVWQGGSGGVEGDATEIYGSALADVLRRPSDSAFIADGSAVVVHAGRRIA
jgi:uncharacterized protein YqjF (DUF2071 family)